MANLPLTLFSKAIALVRPKSGTSGSTGPAISFTPPSLILQENLQRPMVRLFDSRENAQLKCRLLGAPWCPVAYACGYILTNGWSFQDTEGTLPAFCPVPPEGLPFMQQLVVELKEEKLSGHEMAQRILAELKTVPALTELTPQHFETACTCTLLRVGYPVPTGAKDDWLTMPAWALRLPSRRARLQ